MAAPRRAMSDMTASGRRRTRVSRLMPTLSRLGQPSHARQNARRRCDRRGGCDNRLHRWPIASQDRFENKLALRRSTSQRATSSQGQGAQPMKTAITPERAAALIPDGASLLVGGFMGVGSPHRLIDALVARGAKNLTIIANDTAMPGKGIGKLITAGAVSKVVASHIGLNPETQAKMISGEIAVELVPQGTLIERIRAGGVGLGGVLTATGIGTLVEDGKQIVEVDGKRYLLEKPIRAEFALIGAKAADFYGNLEYSLTAHNFNPIIALAGDVVIAEPQTIVPIGVIPPDSVKTPGVLVTHLIERAF